MTGTGDESDADADEGTRERPARDRGSRFEEFFERLDERDEGRQPSSGGDRPAEPSRATPSEGADDAEDEGWVWGDPKPPASDAPKPDAPDRARIWNRADESTDTRADDADSAGSESGSGSSTSPPPEPTGAGTEPADDPDGAGREPPVGDSESASDRWSRLGSALGSTADETGSGRKRPDEELQDGPDARTNEPASTSPPSGGTQESATEAWPDATAGSDPDVGGPDFDQTRELDRLASTSSVLLLGPTDGSVSDALCARLLTGTEGTRDVIFVTFQESPSDRVDICHRADGWNGGNIGVIEVGRGSRNAAVASEITGAESGGSISVRHVSRPGDLSKLGIVITQLLSEFDDSGRRTVLCFHTASDLHREVGTKTLFRFLNTLQGRLNATGALGHYHMNPDLHDEIVVETLRSIFDLVARFSADGDLEIE